MGNKHTLAPQCFRVAPWSVNSQFFLGHLQNLESSLFSGQSSQVPEMRSWVSTQELLTTIADELWIGSRGSRVVLEAFATNGPLKLKTFNLDFRFMSLLPHH